MLDERKASILRAVVEEYIQTAQPVGSGHVVDAPGVSVSSATVRNEMAALETDGYLVQPHTSAGRIPTEKGYRWFVDALAEPALDRSSAQQVRAFFDRTHGEIEQMLADTTRLLTGLTDYAAVVVGPPHEVVRVRSVQLVPLAPGVVLFVAVLGNGAIEKRSIDIDADTAEDTLDAAASHLGGHGVGEPLASLTSVVAAAEVEQLPGLGVVEDGRGVAGIGLDHGGVRGVGQHGPAVRDRDRVEVHVDHPTGRVGLLGDLVHVADRRDARADVEELGDPGLAEEVHRAAQERAVGAHGVADVRRHPGDRLGQFTIGGEVVRAAEEVVVDPGTARALDVEGIEAIGPGRLAHGASPRGPSSGTCDADSSAPRHPDDRCGSRPT